uniref:Uncharacterized protein n=1 Tax=Anguilla anguilla TaxID=7936 RepID=A0A0E9WWW9_ANGAN
MIKDSTVHICLLYDYSNVANTHLEPMVPDSLCLLYIPYNRKKLNPKTIHVCSSIKKRLKKCPYIFYFMLLFLPLQILSDFFQERNGK